MEVVIVDLNGFEIKVTDLDGAIEQSEIMKEFRHDPPRLHDERKHAYWLDLYQKLIQLKSERNGYVIDQVTGKLIKLTPMISGSGEIKRFNYGGD
ncbi:hypothetical protein [Fluviicola sp.]|uniref:hypothetical protein n=1 Tax=Fluviicola sp. TaxID=1917219 RepID=UPI0031D96D82